MTQSCSSRNFPLNVGAYVAARFDTGSLQGLGMTGVILK